MNKVVILEGPDGAGKSMFAEELSDLGWRVCHEGPPLRPHANMFIHYSQLLLRSLHQSKPVVWDRFHLGEIAYGLHVRGRSQLDPQGRVLLERVIAAHGVWVVICLPPLVTAQHNWSCSAAQGQDYITRTIKGTLEDRRRVYQKIWHWYAQVPVSGFCYRYDYTADHALHQLGHRQPREALPFGLIGSCQAKFLVLGERMGRSPFHDDLPFYAMNHSSAYLNEALAEAGYLEEDLAFMNALTPTGRTKDLGELPDLLPHCRTVIALGQTAFNQAMKISSWRNPFILPHPAYWQRFHVNEKEWYVDQLLKIRKESYESHDRIK